MDALAPKINCTEFLYDFDIHGGAVGAITIDSGAIPNGAHILGGLIPEPETDITSDGAATVSLGVKAAGDLHAADAIADLNGGPLWADQITFGETAPVVLTARKGLTLTVAVAALTAGKFKVKVFWVHGS